MRMRDELEQKVGLRFSKGLLAATNQEIYQALLELTQEKLAAARPITGERKLYYISAEFLVGKLLSNNLINLGLYDEVKAALAEAGKDIAAVEEVEPEPSLGNGGLGRLAAAAGKARCQQGRRQKAGDQFFHIENSFTSFFFPAPGPTLFLP